MDVSDEHLRARARLYTVVCVISTGICAAAGAIILVTGPSSKAMNGYGLLVLSLVFIWQGWLWRRRSREARDGSWRG